MNSELESDISGKDVTQNLQQVCTIIIVTNLFLSDAC